MKCIKDFTRSLTLRSDMFAAQPTFRIKGQPSFETYFGGCLSIVLVGFFVAIFATTFLDVLNKINVSASLDLEDDPYSDTVIEDIRVAIGIDGIDFSGNKRYFNIYLQQIDRPLHQTPVNTRIPLSSCSKEDWQNEGENFDKLFDVYQMEKMLCPSADANLSVFGFGGSSDWRTLQLIVEQCNSAGALWSCYSQAEVDSLFLTHFQTNDYFQVNFYIATTIISPQSDNYTKVVLEDQIFLTFTNTSGSRGDIKFGHYSIITDNSIFPISQQTTQTGHYITDYSTHTIQLFSTHYVKIELQKARTIFTVNRLHDKLDNMLSYVGGLFALIFGWIFFFIGSYNEYRYELSVAETTFAIDGQGKKIRENKFHFLKYLQYAIFDWAKTFGCKIPWKEMQQIDECREQVVQQMDPRFILQKMQRFERLFELLLTEHKYVCTQLTKPPTLQRVKMLRKISQYYDKVIKNESMFQSNQIIDKQMNEALKNQHQFIVQENKIANQAIQSDQQFENLADDSDFDSDDQIAQKMIIQSMNQLQKDTADRINKQILGSISKAMQKRIQYRKKKAKRNVIIRSVDIQLQSISDDSPNTSNYDFRKNPAKKLSYNNC